MDWSIYNNFTKDNPPHKSLLRALKYLRVKNKALDIGSGGFRDSRYLITKFNEVTAIDKTRALDIPKGLKFKKTSFEKFVFPLNKYDLINAQFSLPFLPKKAFLKIWKNIRKSLKPNGVFVGQFFGDKDQWVNKNYSFFSKKEVGNLIEDYKIIEFNEVKEQKKLASGVLKKWHYFETIIRK